MSFQMILGLASFTDQKINLSFYIITGLISALIIFWNR